MSILSIKGSLIKKNDKENIESKEGKKWIKQTFVIKTDAEYNNQICFQLFGEEKVQLLESHNEGDLVEVFFNISSREYNNRYYHNVDAWKINDSQEMTESNNTESPQVEDSKENLPF